jgi:hypothetical protein
MLCDAQTTSNRNLGNLIWSVKRIPSRSLENAEIECRPLGHIDLNLSRHMSRIGFCSILKSVRLISTFANQLQGFLPRPATPQLVKVGMKPEAGQPSRKLEATGTTKSNISFVFRLHIQSKNPTRLYM